MTRHRATSDDAEPLIPNDDAPVPPARRPTWWRVRRVRAIAFVCVGLTVGISLASAFLSWRTAQESAEQATAVEQRLAVLEDDLAERARQRDQERDAATARDAEARAQTDARLCELLGQLPADAPNLDRLRATLGCQQPGLDPAALEQSDPAAGVAQRPPEPSPPPGSPAPAGEAVPDPQPEPSDPDRGPLGNLLCGTLPTC